MCQGEGVICVSRGRGDMCVKGKERYVCEREGVICVSKGRGDMFVNGMG